MTIQRIPLVKDPEYHRPYPSSCWAVVAGALAIRPAFEVNSPFRFWVVCHVPSGFMIAPAESKEDARSLVAALQGTLPTTGTLGEFPPPAAMENAKRALLDWKAARVW